MIIGKGQKELLGLWLSENEGAKFWLNVLTELQNRGVKDILIACIDGLKGFPDAINSAFPNTQVQLCIVHRVRNSMKYVPWKDYKASSVRRSKSVSCFPVTTRQRKSFIWLLWWTPKNGRCRLETGKWP